ncbi:MAG: snapalysin family zinc-dependent metalloprotease [Candidatus Nanopelagicales bacterium]|nr:snapalysin family zinc-dependent metalloprotease [Candidatus Nanopelagicales bacterium]MCU0294744.1 snapalysin family zinc-dependent metalloprotease [Candidatus Nanopelagicales bacterium]MCU0298482.1 snapalysin family zinc-dependent metalloprotease [Candidatus Nanopelagicales bacterium]
MRVRAALVGLLGLVLLAGGPAAAYNAPGPRWPGKTIRYYNALPARFDWSVSKATAAWNSSGAKLRFKEVKAPGAAQFTVRFGNTNGYGGYATIGRANGAYLHLSGQYRRADSAQMPVIGLLLAHEFGHVLGLNHVRDGGCRLMQPVVGTGCKQPPEAWLYNCRWLSGDDVRGAIKLYGGKARKPGKRFCPLEPAPPPLQDVVFTGGQSTETPLEITWAVPAGVRPGSSVAIEVYEPQKCSGDTKAPLVDRSSARLADRRWKDDTYAATEEGAFCYEVRVENQYGQTSSPRQYAVSRQAPPLAPPVVGALTEYPDDYTDYLVEVSLPEDSYLHAVVAASGACITTYDENQNSLAYEWDATQFGLEGIPVGPSCISFFAVDYQGRASIAVTREVVHQPRI